MEINLKNLDCLEYMKNVPDKYYDLAIVDPPYGIGFGTFNRTNKDSAGNRYKANKYHHAEWDNETPKAEYFEELFRISKEQIVWGGNYFLDLWQSPCRGFIFWYKENPVDNFSDGEFAWTSFDTNAKCFHFRYYGNIEGKTNAADKIHPTQKPVALYKWLLKNYAKEGDKIFDSHLGSGSIAIAAHDMKFSLDACEIDENYYKAAVKRYENHIKQQQLF